ncbi:MAG: BadF/BadG/BcrA/BcrD ATPase family protein [Nocardioides sp.]|jgi:glucosamine kinase
MESCEEPDALVLGGDIGGTSTRIAVADLDGRILGRAEGVGGNPVAHPEAALRVFTTTLRSALQGLDPVRVRVGVIGMAGGGALADPQVRAPYDAAWREAGLSGVPEVRGDVEVAFAAGTEHPHGGVLVGGTGSVAGRVVAHRLVATVGGHGWLLGDDGSGFWLGREAVRLALRHLDGLAVRGPLVDQVMASLDATERHSIINRAHARSPVALAGLARLVTQAHEAGDRDATAILDGAIAHLEGLATDLLAGGELRGPLVLAGALAGGQSYVGIGLTRRLQARGLTTGIAADPVLGAVRLAQIRASRDRI